MKKISRYFIALLSLCVLLIGCSKNSDTMDKNQTEMNQESKSRTETKNNHIDEKKGDYIILKPSGNNVLNTKSGLEITVHSIKKFSDEDTKILEEYGLTNIHDGSGVLEATIKNNSTQSQPALGIILSGPDGFVLNSEKMTDGLYVSGEYTYALMIETMFPEKMDEILSKYHFTKGSVLESIPPGAEIKVSIPFIFYNDNFNNVDSYKLHFYSDIDETGSQNFIELKK